MYSAEFFGLNDFIELEPIWRNLQNGIEMSYFQTFQWYFMLANLNKNINDKRFSFQVAVVKRCDIPVMIAPLWIIFKTFRKFNRQGVYFWGCKQSSDYLNFIYSDFDEKACDFLFNEIKAKFNINQFYFDDLNTKTSLYNYIKQRYSSTFAENRGICVGLSIPESEEAYGKLLTKSAKQNIRTAFNRAKKDNLEFVFDFDDKKVCVDEFVKLHDFRIDEKNSKVLQNRSIKNKIIIFISQKILGRGLYKLPHYTPYTDDKNAKFMSIKTVNGNFCGAFCYGLDKIHRKIVLMAAATNPEYYKYSPGILLLYKYILRQINMREIDILDFTRGNEPYKYALGGVNHYNANVSFKME